MKKDNNDLQNSTNRAARIPLKPGVNKKTQQLCSLYFSVLIYMCNCYWYSYIDVHDLFRVYTGYKKSLKIPKG